MSRPAVLLDRDGVLTEHVFAGDGGGRPPWVLDELLIVPAAAPALTRLGRAGFALVAVTNQPDVARGDALADDVAAINDVVAGILGLDAVYACLHDGPDGCPCRKPLPGLIHQAADDLELDLAASWLVGDRWVDVAAGRAAGVSTILIEDAGSWRPTSAGDPPADLRPDVTVGDLSAAVDWIVAAAGHR